MGVLVDIVPNHVGVAVARQNRWWWDVLAPRPRPRRTPTHFDVDWDASATAVLVPVLGDGDDGAIEIAGRRRSATTTTASRWRPARAR